MEKFGTWEYARDYLPAVSTVSHTSTAPKLQSVLPDNYFPGSVSLSHQVFSHIINIFSPLFLLTVLSLFLSLLLLSSIKKCHETVLMHHSHMLTEETTCQLFSQKSTYKLIPVQEYFWVISHTQSLSPALDNFCSAHGELALITATLPALKLLSLLADLQHSEAQCKMSNFRTFFLRWLGMLHFRSLSTASLIRINFCSITFIFHDSGGWEGSVHLRLNINDRFTAVSGSWILEERLDLESWRCPNAVAETSLLAWE